MSLTDRRAVLAALAALAGGFAGPATAGVTGVDLEGARRVGRAYLDVHPHLKDAARLRAELLPDGWNEKARARLQARAVRDFRRGALFIHRGWRLSDTEGRLFALAALSAD